ncbi:MAG: methionyl-tRNA formyltransferase [Eubacteriales bacterium]|nr:methionyl-tRNA formyltransferase [Eubacteriales bacterium]MDY3332789.1 methionyl-tRNA formyltransferase [Gallibacter sp.]
MKIIYMGTPDFAVKPLEKLIQSRHEIGYVVTQPDAVRDRGKKLKAPPVKELALSEGIEVLQPGKIREGDFIDRLKKYNPDLIVVVAYGKILPKEVLDIPKFGCINIHGSLLPRWRGAAPIQRAIMSGDEETGVTIMYLAEGMDTGDMIDKAYTTTAGKTSGQMHDELSFLGADLLMKCLDDIENGKVEATVQDDSLVTYAKMLTKEEGNLDFSKDSYILECEIRGLSPWPGAYTYFDDKLIKIWAATIVEDSKIIEKLNENVDGTITVYDKRLFIKTADGALELIEIQIPGKKRMLVKDFMVGNSKFFEKQ